MDYFSDDDNNDELECKDIRKNSKLNDQDDNDEKSFISTLIPIDDYQKNLLTANNLKPVAQDTSTTTTKGFQGDLAANDDDDQKSDESIEERKESEHIQNNNSNGTKIIWSTFDKQIFDDNHSKHTYFNNSNHESNEMNQSLRNTGQTYELDLQKRFEFAKRQNENEELIAINFITENSQLKSEIAHLESLIQAAESDSEISPKAAHDNKSQNEALHRSKQENQSKIEEGEEGYRLKKLEEQFMSMTQSFKLLDEMEQNVSTHRNEIEKINELLFKEFNISKLFENQSKILQYIEEQDKDSKKEENY